MNKGFLKIGFWSAVIFSAHIFGIQMSGQVEQGDEESEKREEVVRPCQACMAENKQDATKWKIPSWDPKTQGYSEFCENHRCPKTIRCSGKTGHADGECRAGRPERRGMMPWMGRQPGGFERDGRERGFAFGAKKTPKSESTPVVKQPIAPMTMDVQAQSIPVNMAVPVAGAPEAAPVGLVEQMSSVALPV